MKRFGLIIVFLSALTGIIPFAGKPVAGLAIQQCFAALTPTIRMIYQSGMSKPSSTVGADARGGIKKTAGCDIVSLALEHRKENGFDILELSGDEYEPYAKRAGDPLLPAKIVYIWVPPGSKVEDVNVKILQKKTLKQPFKIFPKQPEFPVSLNVKKSLVPLRPDLVGSDQPFPESPVQFIETATLREHSMLVFRVQPLQYIPATGSVIVNERFEWQFDSTPGQFHTLKYKKRAPGFEKILDRMVINYQDVEDSSILMSPPCETFTETDQASSDTDCDYLIITSSALSSAFQTLADHKNSMGLSAQIVTTEVINANYSGNDAQEQIKNCIIDYAANHGTVWVLLGGDDTVVPDRNCYGLVNPGPDQTEENTIPTDLYYAGLDDFNWNDDGDSKSCEVTTNGDSVDLYPDVILGRAPVITIADVNAFVSKTIAYITNPPLENFAENALLCGVELWHSWYGHSDACWRTEDMWNTYMAPYWDGINYRFYDTMTDFSGGANYHVTNVHLQEQINDGYGLIFVASHGGQTVWGMESGSNFGIYDAQGCINSNRQGIVYTMACNTNAFDQETYTADPCLSEAFLRNSNGGAVAFVGSSRYGWGNGYPEIEPGTSMRYARKFFHHLFDESAMEPGSGGDPNPSDYPRHLGAVHASHKMYYAGFSTTYGSVRWIQFALNLMGDPHLSILIENPQLLDPPVIEDIVFENCISETGTSGVTVTATDPYGNDVIYTWEALDGGDIVGSGVTVEFDPPDVEPFACPYRVKVTVVSSLSGLSASEIINIYVFMEEDADHDGDVDGIDLYLMTEGAMNSDTLSAFAEKFGENSGCACSSY